MDDNAPSTRRHPLVDALAVVAADASRQAAWVDRHGAVTDEIALNFDDASRMLDAWGERRQIDGNVVGLVRGIDAVFAGMSGAGNSDRWTEEALSHDPGWDRARQLARQALVELTGGSDHALPDIHVIH
ncbi:hypothetical protein ACFXKD_03430 [Nocardiopsis aegyptia]|uniref:hypothetical protein n=1 Tax=Nocardiopsis aegyptia TaxID=220378 RepID=UPI00366AE048